MYVHILNPNNSCNALLVTADSDGTGGTGHTGYTGCTCDTSGTEVQVFQFQMAAIKQDEGIEPHD